MKILEAENINCGYGNKFNIENVSFSIEKEEIIGIIGPNGSGKTTLLRALTRILKLKKGRVLYNGRDLSGIEYSHMAKKVGFVSQKSNTAYMTVQEYILLGRIPHYNKFQFFETKHDIDIANECMKMTDIIHLKNNDISEISGGEYQLAQITRALAQQPELILLDEPTSHLDIGHKVDILDLLKKLNKKLGLTIIIVMHDLNLASEYCDRLILLNKGFAERIGTPAEVIKYDVIEKVYKTVVVVKNNPISKKPYVITVSQMGSNHET